MGRFWDMFERSIIIQGIVTLGFVGVALYIWVTGRELPTELLHGVWLLLGFWFGTKTQHAIDSYTSGKGR